MNKKVPLWMALSASLLAAVVVMVCTLKFAQVSYGKLGLGNGSELFSKLAELDDQARQNFFGELNDEKLSDAMMKGYISALGDDYAAYYSASETEENTDNIEGNGVGIGVEFIIHPETGYLYVVAVHADSPAAKAGIKEGDSVASIAGTVVTKENYQKLINDLKASAGQPVSINIVRAGEDAETPLEVTPAKYASQTVWMEMLDTTAYIKISRFSETTPEQLKKAMEQMSAATSVIFDLRSNPGGTVDSVASVLDYLLPTADLITATYHDGSSKLLHSSDENAALTVPAVVLVNGSTASSGEVFASAMRDVYKAKLVGSKTFGKGVMQTTYKMDDGSSFKFTTAAITTQSGTVFNGKGLSVDVAVEVTEEENTQALLSPTAEDPVVEEALELLNDK